MPELNELSNQPKADIEDIQPKRQRTTVDAFMETFDDVEGGELYRLDEYPSDEEARKLSTLKTEITVMELADGEVVIAKGLSKTQTAFTREDLLELKPVRKAHTHPVQPVREKGLRRLAGRVDINFDDIDKDAVAMMGIIMPNPEDFTLGSVGATTNEIWTEYGKTTYQTYQSEDELLGLGVQMTNSLYTSRKFLTILVGKGHSVEEKITKMNSLLRSLGLSFEFQPWEDQE